VAASDDIRPRPGPIDHSAGRLGQLADRRTGLDGVGFTRHRLVVGGSMNVQETALAGGERAADSVGL